MAGCLVALHRQIGQLAVVGFAGTSLPPEMRALAREFDLGGVILFKRNVESPEQVAEVAVEAQQLARDLPLWVGVDQEGGRVARLAAPADRVAADGARSDGRGDEALAGRFAAALAAELRAVGFSIDFAPVLDVLTNPKNPAIGDRALERSRGRRGADRRRRSSRGCRTRAWPRAASTSRGTATPASTRTSTCRSSRARPTGWRPWTSCRSARRSRPAWPAIMTGHLLVPVARRGAAGDAVAAGSSTGVLRGDLGFDGLVFTDDMDMKAIAGRTDAGPRGGRRRSRPAAT